MLAWLSALCAAPQTKMGNAASIVQGCEEGKEGEVQLGVTIAASNRRMSAPETSALSTSRVTGSLNFDHLTHLTRASPPCCSSSSAGSCNATPAVSCKFSCRQLQPQGHTLVEIERGAREDSRVAEPPAHLAQHNRRATIGAQGRYDPHVLQRLHAACMCLSKATIAQDLSTVVYTRRKKRRTEPVGIVDCEPPPPSPSNGIFNLNLRSDAAELPPLDLQQSSIDMHMSYQHVDTQHLSTGGQGISDD